MASPTIRRPDAILCPRQYPPCKPGEDRHVKRKIEFAPVFGKKYVHGRQMIDTNESLLVPSDTRTAPDESRYYPAGHPEQGSNRHEWYVGDKQADGSYRPGMPCEGHPSEDGKVKIGYLKPDPNATNPQVQAAIQADYDRRFEEYKASPLYVERMKALGHSTGGTDAS